jgi:hypothetical protein
MATLVENAALDADTGNSNGRVGALVAAGRYIVLTIQHGKFPIRCCDLARSIYQITKA